MKQLTIAAAAVWVLLAAGSVLAHHSPVMFDRSKKQTITGSVKEFVWTNPHASIQVDVVNPQGVSETWGVEMNSPNNLVKQGWKSTILKGGDRSPSSATRCARANTACCFCRSSYRTAASSATSGPKTSKAKGSLGNSPCKVEIAES